MLEDQIHIYGCDGDYNVDYHSEPEYSSDESRLDASHPPYDPTQQYKPTSQPGWFIKSTISAIWHCRGIERFNNIDQITDETIELTQQHTELNFHLNPYPIEIDLFLQCKTIILFLISLIKPIIDWVINLVLKIDLNNFAVLFYIFALELASRLFLILVEIILIEHSQWQVRLYKWLFSSFFNLNFLLFLFFVLINVFWFCFWFYLFYFHWINTKCKYCGYNICFNRLNKTKVKDR